MLVVLKYKSEKTHEEVYNLFIDSLEKAITANAFNEAKLEAIRLQLLNCQAIVSKYQYQNKRRIEEQAQAEEIWAARKNITLTLL